MESYELGQPFTSLDAVPDTAAGLAAGIGTPVAIVPRGSRVFTRDFAYTVEITGGGQATVDLEASIDNGTTWFKVDEYVGTANVILFVTGIVANAVRLNLKALNAAGTCTGKILAS